jgi:hypothetical protein
MHKRTGSNAAWVTVDSVFCNDLRSYIIKTTTPVLAAESLYEQDRFFTTNATHVERIIEMGTGGFVITPNSANSDYRNTAWLYGGVKGRYNGYNQHLMVSRMVHRLAQIDQVVDCEALLAKFLSIHHVTVDEYRQISVKKKQLKRFVLQNWTKFILSRDAVTALVKVHEEAMWKSLDVDMARDPLAPDRFVSADSASSDTDRPGPGLVDEAAIEADVHSDGWGFIDTYHRDTLHEGDAADDRFVLPP